MWKTHSLPLEGLIDEPTCFELTWTTQLLLSNKSLAISLIEKIVFRFRNDGRSNVVKLQTCLGAQNTDQQDLAYALCNHSNLLIYSFF